MIQTVQAQHRCTGETSSSIAGLRKRKFARTCTKIGRRADKRFLRPSIHLPVYEALESRRWRHGSLTVDTTRSDVCCQHGVTPVESHHDEKRRSGLTCALFEVEAGSSALDPQLDTYLHAIFRQKKLPTKLVTFDATGCGACA
jgi:hypothetical protein